MFTLQISILNPFSINPELQFSGELLNAGVNRSPSAYLNNPTSERSQYKYNVDKTMTLLKFVDDKWGPVGSFNWFATHGTSMSRTNSLISGDNKGAAARFMEDWGEQNGYPKQNAGSIADPFGFIIKKHPRRVSNIVPQPNKNCMCFIAVFFRLFCKKIGYVDNDQMVLEIKRK